MREILRRAEGFFRKDAQDTRRREQNAKIPELETRLAQLEQELETADEGEDQIFRELYEKYEAVRLELDKILHSHIDAQRDGHEISSEWTALQQALQGEQPSQTPNIRLVIDAIDRLKAEGEWDDSLVNDGSSTEQAAR